MPLRPCANGEPTSIPVHSLPMAPASRPHWRASGVNDPPRVSVAEVSTTVLSANRCSARTSPTSSVATRGEGGGQALVEHVHPPAGQAGEQRGERVARLREPGGLGLVGEPPGA